MKSFVSLVLTQALTSTTTIFDQLVNKINNSSFLNALAIILGICGISVITILSPVGRYICSNWRYWLCKRISLYRGKSAKGYYSEAFVIEHIKKAKQEIRIICVRNTRISSPDILRAFREFVSKNDGIVELFYLDPSANMSDDIIDKIRVTLPTAPVDTATCRREIVENENRIKAEVRTWDIQKQSNLSMFRFENLPSMHLCQFDKKIFLGFQFFDPSTSVVLTGKTLNDYCLVIGTNSALGKLIIEQIDYLRNNLSDKQSL